MNTQQVEDMFANAKRLSRLPHDKVVIERGIRASSVANSEVTEVAMTPWFKNMLRKFDKFGPESRLLLSSGPTKAEKKLMEWVKVMLTKHNAPGLSEKYGEDHTSRQMYDVDCVRNASVIMRQQPLNWKDQVVERIDRYKEPLYGESLKMDNLMLAAFDFVESVAPSFNSSDEFREINLPFMTKHTNVGAPSFTNDRTIDKLSKKSYAELTLEEAERIKSVEELIPFRYGTLYHRVQGKSARAVIGTSRIPNLYFNRVVSPGVAADGLRNPMAFLSYGDYGRLRKGLIDLGEYIENNPSIMAINWDQSQFDTRISLKQKCISAVIRSNQCRDARGKRLIKEMTAFYSSLTLLDGIRKTSFPGYGKTFSGELPTQWFENSLHAGAAIDGVSRQHPQFINFLRGLMNVGLYPISTMGDDILILIPKSTDLDKLFKYLEDTYGWKVHPLKDKGEPGVFYLQHRAYRHNGQWRVSTPWTRVIRSLTFRERPVGLGRFGWYMMMYQQIERLSDEPEILKDVLKFFVQFDDGRLGTAFTSSQFKEGLQAEDDEAQRRGNLTSAQKLDNGDPQRKAHFWNGHEWKSSYIDKMLDLVRDALG